MTTQHEITAKVDAQNWLSTLPREIQIKTLSTQILKEHWLTKNSSALSSALIDCFKQKAWEKFAYMPSVKSKREVKEYKSTIQTYISKELNNYSITVEVKLSEEITSKSYIDSKEKLEIIIENNEDIGKLITEFKLRI